jgi:outer membrane lipoprotein-sorting protein
MKKIFLLAAFFCGVISARAVDTNAIVNAWLGAQTNLQNWTADFTQTRSLKTLTQPLTSTGHLWFQAPNQFRWELLKPSHTIALRQADDMYVIYPQLKRAERYPINASVPGEWREALSLLEAGFPRTRADLDSHFHIGVLTETNGAYQLELLPNSAFVKKMLTDIRVGLATNDFSLTSTELVFIDGSRMRNDFTNGVMNSKFPDGLFDWQPPADYKVTEPFPK